MFRGTTRIEICLLLFLKQNKRISTLKARNVCQADTPTHTVHYLTGHVFRSTGSGVFPVSQSPT